MNNFWVVCLFWAKLVCDLMQKLFLFLSPFFALYLQHPVHCNALLLSSRMIPGSSKIILCFTFLCFNVKYEMPCDRRLCRSWREFQRNIIVAISVQTFISKYWQNTYFFGEKIVFLLAIKKPWRIKVEEIFSKFSLQANIDCWWCS